MTPTISLQSNSAIKLQHFLVSLKNTSDHTSQVEKGRVSPTEQRTFQLPLQYEDYLWKNPSEQITEISSGEETCPRRTVWIYGQLLYNLSITEVDES